MAVPTLSSVNSSASAVKLLAANPNRVKAPDTGAVIENDSTSVLYIGPDSAVTSSRYTLALDAAGAVPAVALFRSQYTGDWWGIWASANGSARVTEFA